MVLEHQITNYSVISHIIIAVGYTWVRNEFFGWDTWLLIYFMLYTISLHEITKKMNFDPNKKCAGPKSKMATSFGPKITKLHILEKPNKIIIFFTRHSQNRIKSYAFLKKKFKIWMTRSEVTACLWPQTCRFRHFLGHYITVTHIIFGFQGQRQFCTLKTDRRKIVILTFSHFCPMYFLQGPGLGARSNRRTPILVTCNLVT